MTKVHQDGQRYYVVVDKSVTAKSVRDAVKLLADNAFGPLGAHSFMGNITITIETEPLPGLKIEDSKFAFIEMIEYDGVFTGSAFIPSALSQVMNGVRCMRLQ